MSKRKPSKTSRLQSSVKTIRDLAAQLGVTNPVIVAYTKRDDWPFSRRAPWPASDIAKMHRWRAEVLSRKKDDNDEPKPGTVAHLRKTKVEIEIRAATAKAETAELENARSRGEMLFVADVKKWIAEHVTRLRNKLLGLPAAIVPALNGLDSAEQQSLLESKITDALNELVAAERNMGK